MDSGQLTADTEASKLESIVDLVAYCLACGELSKSIEVDGPERYLARVRVEWVDFRDDAMGLMEGLAAGGMEIRLLDEGVCRGCGCTDSRACWDTAREEYCHWVEPGLCSVCHHREQWVEVMDSE